MRLRRSDPGKRGYGRRRQGRGFVYVDTEGRRITDPDTLARLRGLAIPPAWRDVWICPDERGHIQATGVDAAGRKQYLYHPVWRAKRDEAKHDHVLEVAARLPRTRQRIEADLAGRGLSRERVLAAIAKLLDLGTFRIGSEEYASGDDATYGVATLRPEHAMSQQGCVIFQYPAKGGIDQTVSVNDAAVCEVLRALRRARHGQERLFAYRVGRQWHEVRSDEVNEYLREVSRGEMTAKDFRTWHATVLAAVRLAAAEPQRSPSGRRRTVARVMREVAELLGNTPAVAKASYVDPRVVDLYHDGVVVDLRKGDRERAVRTLLAT
ncbi:DNA topoisomerase IB [Actinomycetes bacterium KLBMP 9797]